MNTKKLKALLAEAQEFSNFSKYDEAEIHANQVLVAIEKTSDSGDKQIANQLDEIRCSAIIMLSEIKWRRGDFHAALTLALTTIDVVKELNIPILKAKALGNIGLVYTQLSENSEALAYYQEALAINEEIGNKKGVAINLGNIGIIYQNISEYSQALNYYQKALAIQEEIGYKVGIAVNLGNIGIVYKCLSQDAEALDYFQKALAINEEIGNKDGIARELRNIGGGYELHSEYEEALIYHKKALAIHEEIGKKNSIADNLGNIAIVYAKLSDCAQALTYAQEALAIYEEIGYKVGITGSLGNIGALYAMKEFDSYDPDKAEDYILRAIGMCEDIGERGFLYEMQLSLAELYETQERWKEAHEQFKQYHSLKEEVQSEEATKQAQIMENRRKVEESERDRQVKLARFQEQEKILLNILPAQIAERILEGEKRIADLHEHVSVFFSDIVGFTKLSQTISPDELLTMLNEIFSEFDRIARNHGLEKIKTIGDAYMAVAGVPLAQEDHAERAAAFALEVIEYMKVYRKKSNSDLQIRVGLHCGKAIAGVIGENKFAYDLWGDSVNTASRMESHGEAGKIHVSEDFRNALKNCSLQFTDRGEMEVKGKGKMKTYFLERENHA